ncbi:branched-chain-amino-acid aminotransferase-like protein 1 [Asterias rubens]|uniref:branched-chain-amino-acid aminotransferase-like protein 1 n=1 Tax=Asterias rubens TaxID=7604 RepID=UPI00145520B2|nr:branched-chain-amino-acid aminotransferase-like protein 1 [Asterias rubens]
MSDQTRVLLWAIPRTCSSILLKSLSNIPDSQMIFELYSSANFYGPDRREQTTHPDRITHPEPTYEGIELDGNGLLKGPGSGFKSSICSFEWVKQQLEADYQSKKVIIAKELAHFFNRRYKLIPTGYQHVFLIRNPYKVFPSWKKLLIEFSELSGRKFELGDPVLDQFPEVTKPGVAYKEITNLWLHIKENNLDTDPIIIDSDDLLQNPKEILSAVFSRVGIPYSDSLLSWEAGVSVVDQWMVSGTHKKKIEHTETFKNFRNTTGFKKPVHESELPDLATFPPDVQRCIENSMPYYLKLFDQRLKC